MKRFLQWTALAGTVVLGLVACGEDDKAYVEGNDYPPMITAEVPEVYNTAPKPETVINQNNDTNIYAEANNAADIINSEQGKAAIEAGKEAIVTTISGIDKERIKAIAAMVVGEAGATAKKYAENEQASSQDDGFNADWKTLSPSGVRVIDGDTVEVKYNDGRKSDRVRLVGIDAPESSQAYGQESKRALQACVDSGDVTIRYKKEDAYGRLLGVVMAGSKDCNFNQVHSGSAWHYKQYQKEQPAGKASQYSSGESTARSVKQGLWANSEAVEPWKYRKGN